MASVPQTQAQIVFGRKCQAWSPSEASTLNALIRCRSTARELREAFPGRSPASVRRQLTRLRAAEGLLNVSAPARQENQRSPMLDASVPALRTSEEQDWRNKCVASNRRFLARLAELMPAGIVRAA